MSDAVRGTLVGASALVLWASLALLTTWTAPVPPFELVALTFGIAGTGGLLMLARSGGFGVLRQPPNVWRLGVGGLFGYHSLYLYALKRAPAVEASLVNYLWPLLIVLFSGLLPGERLRWWHVAGAGLGFAGVFLLLSSAASQPLGSGTASGYAAALLAAFVWAGYSVLSRRFGHVPSDAVWGFCAATACLAAVCHLALEQTAWPAGPLGWAAVAALGCGPVGIAFVAWDYGVKRGDIRILGGLSYATPLVSTMLLIAFGKGRATPAVVAACIAVVMGAALSARELWDRRR